MAFETFVIALLGFGVGLVFRFNVLLPILLLLLFISIGYSITHDVGFVRGTLTVIGAQVVVQVSYFLGLAVRSWASGGRRWMLF